MVWDSPNSTGSINRVAGLYSSKCHNGERTVLEGQRFPRCGHCNHDTVWIFESAVHPSSDDPQKPINSTRRETDS